MEKLSGFDFKVQYVPGENNVLPDATNLTLLEPYYMHPLNLQNMTYREQMYLMPPTRLPLLSCPRPSWLAVRPWLPHPAGVLALQTSQSSLLQNRHVVSPLPRRRKSRLLRLSFILRALTRSRLNDVIAHRR